MQKIYSRINWENFPSEKTAVNESNLNRMDLGLDNLDDRVIALDAAKFNTETANTLIKDWVIDEQTGVITITKLNGEKIIFDLNIEKIPVNFTLSDDGIITMTTDDGEQFTANIGAMIPILTFEDSDEIAVSVSGEGVNKTYSFSVKNGSITEEKLNPTYLGEIRTQVARAESSATSADASEKSAASSSALAKSYAVGGTGTREGEDADNARYYMEQAKAVSAVDIATTEKAGIVKPDGTTITADEDGTLHGVAKVTVDGALSSTSTNPVQNKAVKGAVDELNQGLGIESARIDELNQNLGVERARIDSLTKLPEGSTTGDAELQDIRVKADGTTATSAGNAVREQVSEIKGDLDELKVVDTSNQLFDYNSANIHGFYSADGDFNERTDINGYYIPVEPNTEYTISGTFTFSASLTSNKTWIASYENTSDPYTLTTPINANYLYVSSANAGDNHRKIIVNEGNVALPKDNFYRYIYSKDYDYSIYNLPYIKKRRVMCNKVNDTTTAYYMGIDCNHQMGVIESKFIWEKGTTSGVVAMIVNPNGADRIKDITDLSLHLTLTNSVLAVDILGNKFGTYSYQRLIRETFDTPMALDGITQHDVIMVVRPSENKVYVFVDSVQYVGTFTPNENISSLNYVAGNYVIYEHYCDGNRDSVSMPMFTQFYAKDLNDVTRLRDDFIREDGILNNTPQGLPYHLFTNGFNIG